MSYSNHGEIYNKSIYVNVVLHPRSLCPRSLACTMSSLTVLASYEF